MGRYRFIPLLFLFCLSPLGALSPDQAVTQYLKDRWSSGNGLPQNSVKTVLQTDDGYIWFGTQEGLVQYNGQRMKVFDQLYFKGATSSEIYTLEQGQPGVIWVGTMGSGLIRFNYREKSYRIFTKKDGLPSNNISKIKQTSRGDLWIDADHKHLVLYRNNQFKKYPLPDNKTTTPILSILEVGGDLLLSVKKKYLLRFDGKQFHKTATLPYAITHLFQRGNQPVLTLGNGGIAIYDPQKDHFKERLKQNMEKWRLTRMLQDRDHNIWITTGRKGIYRLRPGEKHFDPRRDHLKTSMAITLMEDREGSIWIGDNLKGVLRLKEGKVRSYGREEGLQTEGAYVLLPTPTGRFFTGTLDGGIAEFKDGLFHHPFPELKKGMVVSMDHDHEGNIWALFYKKRVVKITPAGEVTTISDNQLGVAVVFVDSSGDIWIGTSKQGIYRYRGGKEIEHYPVNGFICSIVEMSPGEIWVGTFGKGIRVIRDGKISGITRKDGLCDDEIFSIRPQKDGTIWFSTNSGACFYDGKKYRNVKREEGLPVFALGDLVIDHRGNFWGCSNKGIVYAPKGELKQFINGKTGKIAFQLWGKDEGMRNPECNGGSQRNMVLHQNRVYFSTMEGMVEIDPDNLPVNHHKPPVYLEQLIVDGKQYGGYQQQITLPAGSQKIEFHYSGLSFYNIEGVHFRYQLKGYDRQWVDAKRRDVAYYTNLFPGTYTFRVMAANSDGFWSDGDTTMTITIPPLFKQTIWYRVIQIATALTIIIALFLLRIWHLKRQRIRLERLVDQKTRELKEAALVDPLTGLRNRWFVSEVILPELGRFMGLKKFIARGENKRKSPDDQGVYGVYLCDIDHFKKVNDIHGHEAGDRVLKQFSDLLKSCIRENDFLIRWGGEEFLVLLKETNPGYMDQFVCRFRTKLNNFAFTINDQGDQIRKTCSVGYVQFPPVIGQPELFSFDQCVMLADQGLYYSKRNGRDMAVRINFSGKIPQKEEQIKILEDIEYGSEQGFVSIKVTREGDC